MVNVLQVEARAYEIWGGEEGLEEARKRKGELREKKREKKYAKEIKGLQIRLLDNLMKRCG